MKGWRRASALIDRLTGAVGRATSWLVLVMVGIGAFNAVARYLGRYLGADLSSNAYIELQWYLFSLIFLLGGAHALRRGSHVRVDVLYGRLGPRARRWIDLAGTLLFLLPFSVFALWVCWPPVVASWLLLEGSPDPDGLPRYPIKAAILACFVLLLAQAVSEAVKLVAALRDPEGPEEGGREPGGSRAAGA